jgi:uncharacterized protein (TIGR02147 family)
METANAYYITKLKETLSWRQRENPQYSLRAFSRDIGVHPGTLVKVIKGERPLPVKVSKQVLDKLRLGPTERTLFMESLLRKKTNIDNIQINPLDTRFIVDESNYKVISEWEHFAVTDLFEIPEFKATTEDIADRFGIPLNRAEVVVQNLLTSGLLKMGTDGKLIRVHADVKTTEDVKSQALKESHIETMKMGVSKIEEIEVELRDFSSMAAAIDLEQLPEAKTIIREFRQKMTALFNKGSNKTEIYQLAIQLYPLTNIDQTRE